MNAAVSGGAILSGGAGSNMAFVSVSSHFFM